MVTMLVDHPGFGVAVLAIAGLVYVFKLYVAAQNAHLQTAMMIAPLAEKLPDVVETLERMIERNARKD